MDFKGIGKVLLILGLCVSRSDAKGNIWTQQNGNRFNLQNVVSDDVRSWSSEDSQKKDGGGNWNSPNAGGDGRWGDEGGWSSRDMQSKEAAASWAPNDSQSKLNGGHSGFSPSDAQAKDYDKWNAEGNQQHQGSFRPADAQSKDQWNSPAFAQEKIPGDWDGDRGQQKRPWRPEDGQVKDENDWGQTKIDDAPDQGQTWGNPDSGSNSVWNPPGGDDSEGNRNRGTGSGDPGDYKPNPGDGDWGSGSRPSGPGQGGDWSSSSNRNPGEEGPNPGIGGGDWSSGPGPNTEQGGDWPANQTPGPSGQGTGNGDWLPSVGQDGNWPSNPNPGQDNNGPSTGGGEWGSGPSGGQGGDWSPDRNQGEDGSRPPIGDGPTDQGPVQGGPSDSEGPSVGQPLPPDGQWDSNQQGGNRGDTGSEGAFPPRVPQGNYKGGDTPHPGDEGQGRLEDSIPGTPGVDYPNYSSVPATGFDCKQHENPGYYGDVEAKCQVFHICQSDGRHDSFLCPLGTIFNQQYFVCVWWFNYNCDETEMYYGLNADLYKGGHGQGNFKGDPYRGGGGGGGSGTTDLSPPGTGGQASSDQGFGKEDHPSGTGHPAFPEEPSNGPSETRPGNLGGENVADAPGFDPGLETPQQGSGFGQDGPPIPQQGPGYGGQEVSQQGPGFGPGIQDVPQEGPGYGPRNSELGPGYEEGVPQQGIGYGQRGRESPQQETGYGGPGIPEQGPGYEEGGRSSEEDEGIQGGQGTDYGPSSGDWGQEGKRNWGGEDQRGPTNGNWGGGGSSGNGVKGGGWKSPDARGRKARSWGSHHHDDGLNKRWGSESENWISLEEASEPRNREAFRGVKPAWDGHGRRDVGQEEGETGDGWESERRHDGEAEGDRDVAAQLSSVPSGGRRVEEVVENRPIVQWKKEDGEGENDTWLLSASRKNENVDVPRLRKWRTVDAPRKEIELKKIIAKGEANDVWSSPESADIRKLRTWRTVEEGPAGGETEVETGVGRRWWQETLGGGGEEEEEEADLPKGRFARDTPHLFGGWRTLSSQFGHLRKNRPLQRNWNR